MINQLYPDAKNEYYNYDRPELLQTDMTESIQSNLNDYLDYLNGIFIVLVVYGHCIERMIYKDSNSHCGNPAFNWSR